MIKSFTDLEQSKKLAEILPLESADMHYGEYCASGESYPIPNCDDDYNGHCCWSLAALLGVLPKSGKYEPFIDIRYNRIEYHAVDDEIEDKDYLLCYTDGRSLLDACYEMIIKLHELKML